MRPFFYKRFPFRDALRVADQRRGGHFADGHGLMEQLQTGLARQAVPLLEINRFARSGAVFPGVLAAARTGHNVVNVAFLRSQHDSSALAAVG
jgi:hypothetical protein